VKAAGRGFTLIELIVTLAIISILVGMAMPLSELVVKRAKEQDLRHALREIREAIDAYHAAWEDKRIERKVGESGYPKSLEALVDGVEDAGKADKARIYFLRRIPRDPFAEDSSAPAAKAWGRRSYASPPGEPREGDDVFDVFSRARGIGLDGRPYREW
jgi:general secretion pathway protein G